ncbi:epidermal growth factor-like protein 7 isoform X8 [Sturnira hondurensis]|uniref:epidermal growth factor-like protein 7 isoform X8 n=1 Tax=Sturnira hondurensis TaxID=192404 RepID=UPI001879D68B|nr:epidermal growth factor-like protein 7 isoform X8 [Sturnira hondurensis]
MSLWQGLGPPSSGAAEAKSSVVRGPRRVVGDPRRPCGPLISTPWEEPSTGRALGAPTAQKSSCHQCLGHDGAPFSRPPRRRPLHRGHGPCGAAGSCFCCGRWCWRQVAQNTSSGPGVECVPLGLPGALCPSPSRSACTSPSSPPVTGPECAARTGPSTGPPTAEALDQRPPGLATPAAPAGSGPAGSLRPAEQRYASHHVKMEGAVSSRAAATALQDGGVTPARQMWMDTAPEGAAVPTTVPVPRVVAGASVLRRTARQTAGS